MELTQSIASMRSASSLDHPSELSVDDCKALLADLGFLHVPGEPFGAGRAYLLVALRPLPTRAHFDPERIELWTLENGRSQPSEISRIARPATSTFEWGTIRIVDRIPVVNQFVAFGGDLAIANSNGVRTVVLTSDAPILSLGGHSGGADPLAASIGGFFAKLRAAAGSFPTFASGRTTLSRWRSTRRTCNSHWIAARVGSLPRSRQRSLSPCCVPSATEFEARPHSRPLTALIWRGSSTTFEEAPRAKLT